ATNSIKKRAGFGDFQRPQGYIANRDVGNLRQGIIVLGTTAVALPVSAVVAPAITSVTGTSFVGLTASGMVTGGVSLGAGSAAGHTLVGDNASEIAAATVKGTAYGVVLGGAFGAASRFDMSLTGPNAFKLTHGPWAGAQAEFLPFRPPSVTGPSAISPTPGTAGTAASEARYLEYRALRLQGLKASEAHGQMKLFDTGVSGEYAFHFTTVQGGRGIIADALIRPGLGLRGIGAYAGTTPTPSFLLKHGPPPFGWGPGLSASACADSASP
ncbi:MAG TPA: hypothetical protein PKC49_13980, partial [Phycisphaerae bacterium]|nr:hypothetical protein [Phycisphaerae bacterium]